MLLLLVNPNSGRGRGAQILKRCLEYLDVKNIDREILMEPSFEDLRIKFEARFKQGNVGKVVVIGGDGMVHLAISLLAHSNIPMVLLPAGTGDDFARSLHLPLKQPEKILDYVFSNSPRAVDLARANDRYFAQVLSTGFDSQVNKRANELPLSGRWKYVLALLVELVHFKVLRYKFKIDGSVFTREAVLVAVANGPCYGGGMKIAPGALIDDSLLDLIIVGQVSIFEFLRVFPKVYNGNHIDHRSVEVIKISSVEIDADTFAFADGEYISLLPVAVAIQPNALLTWVL
jgi:diacylglycerol kinase (ATP)